MEAHNENAIAIAEYLSKDKKIKKIYYPGLSSHPQQDLAQKQMRGFGGIISVETESMENAKRFTSALKVFTLGESLGGVESLVCDDLGSVLLQQMAGGAALGLISETGAGPRRCG